MNESPRTVFLVNPASENGATGRRWPEIANRAAAAGLSGDALLSERPGQLTELARRAADDGAELLVAVGGDGTVHEVVNGIAGRTGVDLAVLPRGTGRDFVRTHGIPHRLDDALRTARDGRIREVDLGLARFRSWQGEAAEAYFANIASAGMSGSTAEIDADEPLPVELDGEQPGTTPARFELVPRALRLRVPRW